MLITFPSDKESSGFILVNRNPEWYPNQLEKSFKWEIRESEQPVLKAVIGMTLITAFPDKVFVFIPG